MKRIGILTAGGDTPALNASIYGAVVQANLRRIEVYGLIKGFSSLFNPRVPHVHLNPLFTTIPELDQTLGGTILGASRDYVDPDDKASIAAIAERLARLGVEGLICIGGDGTLNGMQPLSEVLPTVLAPKTIDNDLGLNHRSEPDEFTRETTAESHRRIGIIEVMGRHSGYIGLGTAYGQPDILLVPEHALNVELLVERVVEIYELQKHVVIACAEGVVDAQGRELGAEHDSTDPAGNLVLSGAAETLRKLLIKHMGDTYFTSKRRNESAKAAIFTRKVGHTQRGGRPILFDRFYGAQLGGHAVEMLLRGAINSVAILQWNREKGFHVDDVPANDFRDRWGLIHARQMHPSFYNPAEMKPSRIGIDYLMPIFSNALGHDDIEAIRQNLFNPGNLTRSYHSINVDVNKRIRYLD
jgi:6-phosphofructokinase